jgi:signal transduction histidine kinase
MTRASLSGAGAVAGSTLGAAYEARRALKNMARVLGMKGGAAWLEDRDNARFVPLAHYRVPSHARAPWREAEFPANHPLTAELARRRRPVVPGRRAADHPLLAALADRPILAIPMLAREQLVGFFIVSWGTAPRRLSTRDVRVLEGISRVVTVTIDHARLYNEAERRRREAEILTGVVHAINDSLDLDTVLQRVTDAALDLCRADAARIALRDDAADTMTIRYGAGTAGSDDTAVRLEVPVREGGGVVGLISVSRRAFHPFGDGDEAVLVRLAAHAAAAIRNAELYAASEEGRQAAERLAGRLAETLELQSEFLANTTHELRTPLCGIMSLLTAVVDGLCHDDAERAQFIREARASASELLDLITNLLDMAKIDAGRLAVDCEPVDLSVVFEEVNALVAPVALRSPDVRLAFEPPSLATRFVRGDGLRLRQVLVNLVGNSLKFTPAGEIAVRVVDDGGVGVIEVVDTGIGVAPEHLGGRLFEKFVQADGSTSRTYGGTGLGLAICKALVELMEGSIVLQSDGVGLGTRVAVSLPLCDPAVETSDGVLVS